MLEGDKGYDKNKSSLIRIGRLGFTEKPLIQVQSQEPDLSIPVSA